MRIKNIKKKKDGILKPFNSIMQICPKCGKLDAYKGDNHECNTETQWQKQCRMNDYYD